MEVDFPEEVEEEPLEPLRMEHFYFSLILWAGGMLMSAIAFLASIIFKRKGSQQKNRT